jgi:glutamyl-tRNA(Gln) amidotransferase subunit D
MKLDIEPSSKVKVKTKEQELEGLFIESPNKDSILIKLKSGYNVGFDKKDIIDIKVLEKSKKIEQEAEKVEQDKKLQGIAIIITGGTIASKVDYETGAVKPIENPADLLGEMPNLNKIARINSVEAPFLILSEDITSEQWKKLAKKVCELVNKPENKGIVILHGTDTLHYTAAALAFMLQDLGKPVVLTYSQRSVDRGSSDSYLNLKCAFHAALSNIAEVIVVGHATTDDNYCHALRGSSVRKMHSSRRDTFKAINTEPLAKIYENGNIESLSEHRKRDENKKTKVNIEFEDKVAIIKFAPNSNPEIIEHYIKKGYRGIVIEGTGFGHVATEGKLSWLYTLKGACKKAVVCMTTQTIYGEVNPKVYSNGRLIEKAGVLYLNMTSEAAYVKLSCMLGREKNLDKVKSMMLQNLAHEINEGRVE